MKVVGIGEILWDVFPSMKQLGGAAANFVYHCKCLGLDSIIVSAIGLDNYGKEILQTLNDKNINSKYIQLIEEYPTGLVKVVLNSLKVPTYEIQKNVAWDFLSFTPELKKIASEIDAVFFGTLIQRSPISKRTLIEFLENTTNNCLKLLDINIRQNFYSDKIVIGSLELANCLKINYDELQLLAQILALKGSEDELLNKILNKYNLKFIALTKGESGSTLYTRDKIHKIIPPKIKIVDTVGAGDAFSAALIFGFLKGEDLVTIHSLASRLASYVCTKIGGMTGMPHNKI